MEKELFQKYISKNEGTSTKSRLSLYNCMEEAGTFQAQIFISCSTSSVMQKI